MAVKPSLMPRGRDLARYVPPLAAAVPIVIFSASAMALPLAAAQALGLTSRQTATWILALYGVPGMCSLVLTRGRPFSTTAMSALVPPTSSVMMFGKPARLAT